MPASFPVLPSIPVAGGPPVSHLPHSPPPPIPLPHFPVLPSPLPPPYPPASPGSTTPLLRGPGTPILPGPDGYNIVFVDGVPVLQAARPYHRPVKLFSDIDDTLFANYHDASLPSGNVYVFPPGYRYGLVYLLDSW
jgi:hypothetical protein